MRQPGYYCSRHLGSNVDFVWHGDRGAALILFPTSGGNHLENEDRGLVRALGPAIDAGTIQAICVASINNESWGRKDLPPAERLRRHDLYDAFMADEFVPWVKKHSRHPDVMLYGASMGGFHALNLAARHPELIKRTIALSGFFDIQRVISNGYWDELAYYHSPVHFVPNMNDEWCQKLSRVEWVIATGEQDSLVEETRRMAWILRAKGIPVHEEIWPGVFGHDWPYWQEHLPRLIGEL
jgi:esterase/lipase superfamily enzyme